MNRGQQFAVGMEINVRQRGVCGMESKMKKKIALVMAAMLAAGVLGGCGSKDANKTDDSTVLKDMAVEQYVTLGEYKGLEVAVDAPVVDQSQVDALVKSAYSQYVTSENGGITDRAVEVGDTVNIDYEGKKDGIAFQGGTAQGYNLTIGSGQFIDGFEDGLVGVMPGDTVDLDLTFPEVYQSADLAGQAVVFTVTVNYIVSDEMNDDVIAAMGIDGVNTVDEFRQYANDYLESNLKYNYDSQVQNEVMNAFMANCVFSEVPEKLAANYEAVIRDNVMQQAESYGMEAETYVQQAYNEDLETWVKESATEAAKQNIAFQAVANAENLGVDDEELNTTMQEYATNAGYETVEEFIGDNSIEDYRDYLMYQKVMDFLVQNAVVNN